MTHQTSCFWPATLAAGLKGSPLVMVDVTEKGLDILMACDILLNEAVEEYVQRCKVLIIMAIGA